MATNEKVIELSNRVKSIKSSSNPETNHIIAGADDIFDDSKRKKQSTVNQETDEALNNRYTKEETYSKSQLNNMVAPQHDYITVTNYADLSNLSEHPVGCVYRVSNYDGTNSQVDATKYSEYSWDGIQYIHLATKSQISEVFDVSVYNATGGTLATYDSLEALLSDADLNTIIPEGVRHGGMRLQFVLTGDNKYIQARCMAQNFTTDVTQWQGVDDEPIPNSPNLPKSGGVAKYFVLNTNITLHKCIYTDGSIGGLSSSAFGISDYYYAEIGAGIINGKTSTANIIQLAAIAFYDEHFKYVGLLRAETVDYNMELDANNIPVNAVYFRANLNAKTGLVRAKNAMDTLENAVNLNDVTLSIAYPFNLKIDSFSPATTIDGVSIPNGTIRISSGATNRESGLVWLYLDKSKDSFYGTSRPVKIVPNDNPIYLLSHEYLFIHVVWSEDTNIFSTLVASASQLHRTNPQEYVLLGQNIYGRLTNGLLLDSLSGKDMYNVTNGFNIVKDRELGYIRNTDGVLNAVDALGSFATPYFYAIPGTQIQGVYDATSYKYISFYDHYLNFISSLEVGNNQFFLNSSNIPANASYFRTNLETNGFVNGIVAEGLEQRNISKNEIFLSHEFGKAPIITANSDESITLRYNSETRIFIEKTTGEYAYNFSAITIHVGDINIPRYSILYVDIANERYAVGSNTYTVIDTETGYDVINGVSYYGQKTLPNGQFLRVLVVGAKCALQGILLDSISDLRLQSLEARSTDATLKYSRLQFNSYICSHRDNIPTISKGDTSEGIKITYPSNSRVFLCWKNKTVGTDYVNISWSLNFPAGTFEMPRYSFMYADLENIYPEGGTSANAGFRITIYKNGMEIDPSSEYYHEDSDGTGYLLINGIAYYNTILNPDRFVLLVANGAGVLLYGPWLDSLTDARLRGLEKTTSAEGEIARGSIFNFNPASEYSSLMVNAKSRRYDRVNAVYTDYPISLLWFSDLHYNEDNLKRIVNWKNKYASYIDDAIATGDQQSLYFTDDFSWWNDCGASKFLQVIGNHDAWISKAMYQTGDYDDIVERGYGPYDSTTGLYAFYIIKQKSVYDKYFKDRISSWGVTQPANAANDGKNYYYKDYNSKVRLIVLDAKHYGSPDDLDGNNQSIQDAWFTSVLADARTNNMEVVAVSHYYPRLITQNRCSWNYNYWGGNGDDKLNSLATTAVTNFINAGGTFICWMVGHTHYDDIGLITTDNNQLVIGCSTANNTRSTAFVRPTGTKLQDSFNIISFDTSDGKVNILKVGGDTNNNFTRRRVLSYQYKAVTDEFGVEHQKGLIFSE